MKTPTRNITESTKILFKRNIQLLEEYYTNAYRWGYNQFDTFLIQKLIELGVEQNNAVAGLLLSFFHYAFLQEEILFLEAGIISEYQEELDEYLDREFSSLGIDDELCKELLSIIHWKRISLMEMQHPEMVMNGDKNENFWSTIFPRYWELYNIKQMIQSNIWEGRLLTKDVIDVLAKSEVECDFCEQMRNNIYRQFVEEICLRPFYPNDATMHLVMEALEDFIPKNYKCAPESVALPLITVMREIANDPIDYLDFNRKIRDGYQNVQFMFDDQEERETGYRLNYNIVCYWLNWRHLSTPNVELQNLIFAIAFERMPQFVNGFSYFCQKTANSAVCQAFISDYCHLMEACKKAPLDLIQTYLEDRNPSMSVIFPNERTILNYEHPPRSIRTIVTDLDIPNVFYSPQSDTFKTIARVGRNKGSWIVEHDKITIERVEKKIERFWDTLIKEVAKYDYGVADDEMKLYSTQRQKAKFVGMFSAALLFYAAEDAGIANDYGQGVASSFARSVQKFYDKYRRQEFGIYHEITKTHSEIRKGIKNFNFEARMYSSDAYEQGAKKKDLHLPTISNKDESVIQNILDTSTLERKYRLFLLANFIPIQNTMKWIVGKLR